MHDLLFLFRSLGRKPYDIRCCVVRLSSGDVSLAAILCHTLNLIQLTRELHDPTLLLWNKTRLSTYYTKALYLYSNNFESNTPTL